MRLQFSFSPLVSALTAAAASFLFGSACSAQAQSATESPAPGYMLLESESWELTSEEGDRYEIFVSMPSGTPPPADGYPVPYVLDGNTIFASFAEARRIQEGSDANIANTLIIAVGCPADKATTTYAGCTISRRRFRPRSRWRKNPLPVVRWAAKTGWLPSCSIGDNVVAAPFTGRSTHRRDRPPARLISHHLGACGLEQRAIVVHPECSRHAKCSATTSAAEWYGLPTCDGAMRNPAVLCAQRASRKFDSRCCA